MGTDEFLDGWVERSRDVSGASARVFPRGFVVTLCGGPWEARRHPAFCPPPCLSSRSPSPPAPSPAWPWATHVAPSAPPLAAAYGSRATPSGDAGFPEPLERGAAERGVALPRAGVPGALGREGALALHVAGPLPAAAEVRHEAQQLHCEMLTRAARLSVCVGWSSLVLFSGRGDAGSVLTLSASSTRERDLWPRAW